MGIERRARLNCTAFGLATVFGGCALLFTVWAHGAQRQQRTGNPRYVGTDLAALQRDDFSPAFLGLYRKVMEIEDQIRTQADAYGLDYDLARAVCLYESGGNANLTSWAGAKGYFQVMPATRRLLGVDDNIEAGVKYLKQLVDRFEREDYALAAYNGGPGNVGRRRPMRLETLQYVLGVGHYRMALKLYDQAIRRYASELQLEIVGEGDDWWTIANRLEIPLVVLRLYNPYLGIRERKPGQLVSYPAAETVPLFRVDGDSIYYRTRLGDNYLTVGLSFEVPLNAVRQANGLWHLQTLPPGIELRLPLLWINEDEEDDERDRRLEREAETKMHRVMDGQTIDQLAEIYETSPWRLIRDNAVWDEQLHTGVNLKIVPEEKDPQYVRHTVRRGETLTAIAIRYGTSVRAIQEANGLGNRTMIRIGQELMIPAPRE